MKKNKRPQSTVHGLVSLRNYGLWTVLLLLTTYHLPLTTDVHAVGQRVVGTSGGQFLNLPVNARAIGMGEAYSAVSDGADAIVWNPAGLGRVEGKSISLMHAVYFQDIFYDFAAYAQKMGNAGTFGLAAQYLSANSIDETNEFGTNVGTFRPQDLAINFGWAREFPEIGGESKFILGLTGKYIQSRLVETAVAGAVDVGIAWKMLEEKLWFAIGAQNFGTTLKFKNESDTLPINVRVGWSYKISQSFLVAMDF